MSPEILIWLFGSYGVGIAGAFGFAWTVKLTAERELAKAADRDARLKDELMVYKVHVSDTFASMAYVADIERRTVSALNDIKNTQLVQDQKLDRLIERGPARA